MTKEERAAYSKEYRIKNKAAIQANEKARRKKNKLDHGFKDREWERHLRQRYGITGAQYEAMFLAQEGKCKLCGRPPSKIKLHTDHCHTTGIVRGLLCHQCNWYLSKIDEDPGILDRIAEYRKVVT